MKIWTVVFVVLALVLGLSSVYIIDETQQVVITQFGRPVGEPIREAGLHFKIPFIQHIHYFDKRVLEWDGDADQIPTKDKRFIWVDTTARWRVKDPLQFFRSVRDEMGAQTRLDDIIDAAVRDAINGSKLIEIVRTTNRLMSTKMSSDQQVNLKEEITKGREEIRKQIFSQASKMVEDLGIELIDVQIKRVNYVEEVRRKVYARMIAERKRVAERYRSQGRGEQAKIVGMAEKEVKKILSEAYKKVQEIRGKADAEAMRIYAQAYSKGADFFRFWRTIEAYRNCLGQDVIFLLSLESPFFRILKDMEVKE